MNYKILLLVSKLISKAFSISFCQHVNENERCSEISSEKCSAKQVLLKSQKLYEIMKPNVNSLQTLANIPILTTEKTNKK